MNFTNEFSDFLESIPVGFEQQNSLFFLEEYNLELLLVDLETIDNFKTNRLIIRKFDWILRKAIIQSKILTLLSKNLKIHGRKTNIKRIDTFEAKVFLDKYHLKGYFNAKIKFGCFLNEELIAVMTFGNKRNFNKVEKFISIEMIQFATKTGLTIVGGLDKMLKFAEQEINPNEIMTYLDLELTINPNWGNLGFIETGSTKRLIFEVNPDSFETKKVNVENTFTFKNLGNKKMIRKNQNLG